MCGRARCTLNPQQIARTCGIPPDSTLNTVQMDRYRPSYNVSPGAYIPVVVRRAGGGGGRGSEGEGVSGIEAFIHCMKWGLVPGFTKKSEKPDHYRMFNARSESIHEKASFRRLISNNRCLVAVEGFYEWKKDGSKKQPYYIHFKDQRPLVFAALYDCWTNSDGEVLHTFTILTTCSSSAFQWLHDRMPVILGNKVSIDEWLDGSPSKFNSVLGPYEGPDLVWYPVTAAVGKPSFDGPECIKEIQLKPAEKNLISKFFCKKSAVDKDQSGLDVQASVHDFHAPDLSKVLKEKPCTKEDEEQLDDILHGDVKKEVDISVNINEEPSAEEHKDAQKDFGHDIVKKETEICGAKRDSDQMAAGSDHPTENIEKPIPSSSKKKGRRIEAPADGQLTLLSFFGKR